MKINDDRLRKEAGTAVSDPTIGSVLNTFINPLAAIVPGDYWVPESLMANTGKDIENAGGLTTGNSPWDKLIFQSGAIGLTWGALAALARFTHHRYEDVKQKAQARQDRMNEVSAVQPVFSPDPNLNDTEEEKRKKMIGAKPLKHTGPILLKESSEGDGLSKSAIDVAWLQALLPLAAGMGATAVGYKGMDQYMTRQRRDRLNQEIADLSNELDRLNYIKLMRARGHKPEEIPPPYGEEPEDDFPDENAGGLPKEGVDMSALSALIGGGATMTEAAAREASRRRRRKRQAEAETRMDEYYERIKPELMAAGIIRPDGSPVPEGGEDEALREYFKKIYREQVAPEVGEVGVDAIAKEAAGARREQSGWNTPKALTALLFLSLMTTGTILGKRYFDEEDPHRRAMDELKKATKELERREVTDSPIHVAPLNPELRKTLNSHIGGRGGAKRRAAAPPPVKSISAAPVDIPTEGLAVDKSDPTMALL